MKKRELEERLRALGWYFDKEGGSHEIWSNGKIKNQVPRHNEIKEKLAKSILRKAQDNPR